MSSCSSGETLATPRRGKCLRQRETDEGTVLWKISHIFFVEVDSELNVNSRPLHWSRAFACCYLGHSHSAEKRVRIFLAMETFKSSHTLVCRGPKQEFMAPLSGRRRKLWISR